VCLYNVSVFSYVKSAGLESEETATPIAKLKNRWSYPYLPPYAFMASFYVLSGDSISLTLGTVGNSVVSVLKVAYLLTYFLTYLIT